jgi:hypothetical protein
MQSTSCLNYLKGQFSEISASEFSRNWLLISLYFVSKGFEFGFKFKKIFTIFDQLFRYHL